MIKSLLILLMPVFKGQRPGFDDGPVFTKEGIRPPAPNSKNSRFYPLQSED